jgi:hypothetical protein
VPDEVSYCHVIPQRQQKLPHVSPVNRIRHYVRKMFTGTDMWTFIKMNRGHNDSQKLFLKAEENKRRKHRPMKFKYGINVYRRNLGSSS